MPRHPTCSRACAISPPDLLARVRDDVAVDTVAYEGLVRVADGRITLLEYHQEFDHPTADLHRLLPEGEHCVRIVIEDLFESHELARQAHLLASIAKLRNENVPGRGSSELVARAIEVLGLREANEWILHGDVNGLLPMEALATRGPAEVFDALDNVAVGPGSDLA